MRQHFGHLLMCDVGVGCMTESLVVLDTMRRKVRKKMQKSLEIDESKSKGTSWPHAHTYKVTSMQG